MKRDLAAFRVSQKQETVTEERNRSRRIQRTRFSATLNDAAGQQRVEVHGEVVDGSTAGFGNILGAGAPPPGKKRCDLADSEPKNTRLKSNHRQLLSSRFLLLIKKHTTSA